MRKRLALLLILCAAAIAWSVTRPEGTKDAVIGTVTPEEAVAAPYPIPSIRIAGLLTHTTPHPAADVNHVRVVPGRPLGLSILLGKAGSPFVAQGYQPVSSHGNTGW